MPFRSKAGAQHSLSPYRWLLLGGDDTKQPQILKVVCSILYAKMNIGGGQRPVNPPALHIDGVSPTVETV